MPESSPSTLNINNHNSGSQAAKKNDTIENVLVLQAADLWGHLAAEY